MKMTIQPQDTKSLAQTWHAMTEFYSTASLLLSINSLLQSYRARAGTNITNIKASFFYPILRALVAYENNQRYFSQFSD